MAKSKGSKEFEPSVYIGVAEPGQTDMGASKLNYGEQRFGFGEGEEPREYLEPGSEGAEMIRMQIENGGVGSHERFDNPMKATPTGEGR